MNRYKIRLIKRLIRHLPDGICEENLDKTYFSFIAYFFISQDRNGGTSTADWISYCRF